jgi:Zn-dependent protease/CBS domain-containing protein
MSPITRRSDGLQIGRIVGIAIRVQWSLLIVFALIATSLATGLVPDVIDHVSPLTAWIAGVVGATCFLLSLLAHELSHSVVAKRHGVGVHSITLWLLGGVARIDRDPPDARAALRIAIAGPLMSLALAGGFAGVATALDAAGDDGIWTAGTTVFGWLALMNAMLAIFNLLPGAPLDGGRVLRAWFWHRSGDRLGSQARAARAGRTLARLMIAVGIVELAFGAGAAGLWLALVGWFVLSAASAEELDAELRMELGGVRVARIMTPDPVTVPPTMTITALVEELLLQHRSAYPVVGPSGLVGLVTLQDVRRVLPDHRATTTVERIMTPLAACATAAPDDEVIETLAALGGPRRLLVVDDDRLVGIVTPTDITRVVEAVHLAAAR